MEIKLLGTGCNKCEKMEANTRTAIKELGIEASIVKVEDLVQIMRYGVMSTPGFVMDDKVKTVGKVLTVAQIKKLLSENK